jgi:hypothetical protein
MSLPFEEQKERVVEFDTTISSTLNDYKYNDLIDTHRGCFSHILKAVKDIMFYIFTFGKYKERMGGMFQTAARENLNIFRERFFDVLDVVENEEPVAVLAH